MPPKTRQATLLIHERESRSSSPDPLALSAHEDAPRTRQSPSPSKALWDRLPLSPQPSNFSIRPRGATPAKSIIMSTGKRPGTSPWRIKVTVEAEPEDGGSRGRSGSPSKAARIGTTTVTVPLKSPDNSPVRKRGRPKKAERLSFGEMDPTRITPIKTRKRAERSPSKDAVGDIDGPLPVKRRPGRPRKVVQPEVEPALQTRTTPDVREDEGTASMQPTPSPRKAARGRPRKSLPPATEAAARDTPEVEGEGFTSPVQATPFPPDIHQPAPRSSPFDQTIAQNADAYPQTQAAVDGPATGEPLQLASEHSTVDTHNDFDDGVDDDDDEEDDQVVEPTYNGNPGETTVFNSEEFSMVSINSLPSIAQQRKDTSILNTSLASILEDISEHSSSSAGPPFHIKMPPPPQIVKAPRIITPIMPYVAPVLPATPSPPQVPPQKPSPASMSRAVRAGAALQGAVRPDQENTPSSSRHRHARSMDPFDGFGHDTRRQLRQSLQLGEALARESRAQSELPVQSSGQKSSKSGLFAGFGSGTRRQLKAGLQLGEHLAAEYEGTLPDAPALPEGTAMEPETPEQGPSSGGFKIPKRRQDTEITYPRLPTPDEQRPLSAARMPVQYPNISGKLHHSQLLTPRGSVQPPSRETSQAPAMQSQAPTSAPRNVVHIASDSESDDDSQAQETPPEDEDDDVDIWQEEANRSAAEGASGVVARDVAPQPSIRDVSMKDAPSLAPKRAADVGLEFVEPPRRMKLPRTWRRTSGADFIYSDEPAPEPSAISAAPEESGFFARPQKQAARPPVAEKQVDVSEVFSREAKWRDHEARRDISALEHQLEQEFAKAQNVFQVGKQGATDFNRRLDPEGIPELRPTKSTAPVDAYFPDSSVIEASMVQTQDSMTSDVRQIRREMGLDERVNRPQRKSDNRSFLQNVQNTSVVEHSGTIVEPSDARQIRRELETVAEPTPEILVSRIPLCPGHHMGSSLPATPLKPIAQSPRSDTDTDTDSECEEEQDDEPERLTQTVITSPQPEPAQPTAHSFKPVVPFQKPASAPAPSAFAAPGIISRIWSLFTAPPPPRSTLTAPIDNPRRSKKRIAWHTYALPTHFPFTFSHWFVLDTMYQDHKQFPFLFVPSAVPSVMHHGTPWLSFIGMEVECRGYKMTVDLGHVCVAARFWELLTVPKCSEVDEKVKKLEERDPEPECRVDEAERYGYGRITEEMVVYKLGRIVVCEPMREDERRGLRKPGDP